MDLIIDPGTSTLGAAAFVDGRLYGADALGNPYGTSVDRVMRAVGMAKIVRAWVRVFPEVRRVVVEFPQVYQGSKQTGDPNDLTKLACVDGAIAAMFPDAEVFSYGPREWKGQLDSNTTAERILERLDAAERLRIEGYTKLTAKLAECLRTGKQLKDTGIKEHNTLDAVGIGLKFLGRFDRKRVWHD